ncbi:MAG: hypothetical protein HN712_05500 [Gemmatimonadetes bacterium]|jgi:hypothetical protein|nr:hypothetical protein [Gemmatimonadota bacterium]MBT7859744.1 hypothetical protein [Gemmatimonadota bacterium]
MPQRLLTICLSLISIWALNICAVDAQGSDDGFGGDDRSKTGPSYGASMGSVTVGDTQVYRLSMRPEIPLGRWGLAFDVELFIDETGDFSSRGWSFGTTAETVDTILRKLYYVRYGKPGDDVFVRVGALDHVTLGYGLVLDGYRNTLEYPGIKKTGIHFQLESVAGSSIGLEGMINNLQDLESGGGLVGLRAYTRPMAKLEIGVTYVADLDQYAGLLDRDDDGFPDAVDAFPEDGDLALDNDGDGVADDFDGDDDNDGIIDTDVGSGLPADVIAGLDALVTQSNGAFQTDTDVSRRTPFNRDRVGRDPFGIAGLDVGYRLIDDSKMRLILYGQLAMMVDDDDALDPAAADSQGVNPNNRKAEGFGIMAPGLWATFGPLDGRIEYRYFQDDFEAGYFDNLYELDRARIDAASGLATPKDAQLLRGESLSGVFGRLSTDLWGLVEASADYQHLVGSDDPRRQMHARGRVSPALLESIPRLSHASAYYQKNHIGSRRDEDGTPGSEDGFFESTEDTFYGYEVGAEMASGVSVVWDTRFLFERAADGRLKRRRVMAIETVFNF